MGCSCDVRGHRGCSCDVRGQKGCAKKTERYPNLTENTNGEIFYKNDLILSPASGRRETLQHKQQVYFVTYSLKFEEIILETQIQLGKRFGDFV